MLAPLPITLTPALGTHGHLFLNGLRTGTACCCGEGERGGWSQRDHPEGMLGFVPSPRWAGKGWIPSQGSMGFFSPGFQAGGCLESQAHPLALVSPVSEELSRVKQQANGRAYRGHQTPQPPAPLGLPPSKLTDGSTSRVDMPWLPPHCWLSSVQPCAPIHPTAQPSSSHSLSQLLLRLCWGRGTKAWTHGELQSLRRRICGGNQISGLCVF